VAEEHIKQAQVLLGVDVDGKFGPDSLAGVQRVVAQLDECMAQRDSADEAADTVPTGSQELAAVNPTGFRLSKSSKNCLIGVHADLIKVVLRAEAITTVPFAVIEGMRTLERQRELVEKGASRTMNSRHLTGHAVDIAPLINGKVSWHWPHYRELEPIIKRAAAEMRVQVDWGGDWTSFKDGPHWELRRSVYP
jgi:hypothetical protein